MAEKVTIGNCELWHGDCREVLPLLPKFDAVITDPPYGMALDTDYSGIDRGRGKEYDRVIGDDEPFDPRFLLPLAQVHVIWGAQYFAQKLPENGGWLVFNKRGDGKPSQICFGDCELAWSSIHRQSVRMWSQVWHGPARWHYEGAYHPTQKSIGLMEWCIEQAGKPRTVFDPYMGSGTTGVACARMGLHFTGIERERKYFDIAVRRIEQAYAQPRLFEDAKVGSGDTAQHSLLDPYEQTDKDAHLTDIGEVE